MRHCSAFTPGAVRRAEAARAAAEVMSTSSWTQYQEVMEVESNYRWEGLEKHAAATGFSWCMRALTPIDSRSVELSQTPCDSDTTGCVGEASDWTSHR